MIIKKRTRTAGGGINWKGFDCPDISSMHRIDVLNHQQLNQPNHQSIKILLSCHNNNVPIWQIIKQIQWLSCWLGRYKIGMENEWMDEQERANKKRF